MIRRNTVFVLGAGASQPYGLPLGWELSQNLQNGTKNSYLAQELYQHCGIPREITDDFSQSFLRSGRGSIDAFLANRGDLNQIGKLAIAYELCTRENPGEVFRVGNNDNWYRWLWDVMLIDAETPVDVGRNTVKFVTFNYDRSLEFFLHEATKNNFRLDDKQAFESWSKIGILHLYGSLGTFNFKSPEHFRDYDATIRGKTLQLAAEGIKVIPESRDGDDKDFQRAGDWLYKAEEIVFLGFGFDPLNVKRLGLNDILGSLRKENKQIPRIWASLHDKTQAERDIIKESLCPEFAWWPLDFKNLDALRNSRIFG